MGKTVTIYCKNTRSYHDFPLGTSLIEIYRSLNIQLKYQVVAARVNYKVEDLNFLIYKPKDIEFIDLSTSSGMRVYVRTLTMVVAKAVSELFPKGNIRIEHPLSKGYYCVLNNIDEPLTQSLVDKIKERINLIISQGKTIICEEKQTSEVIKLFADQKDKIVLFQTLGNP
ncbi:MAG TPA: nucleoside kinase, partial [Paludibacteraceae bacterium]|nr:nucleoside kinase [Paludibacteraceae bacterium]